MLWYSLVTSSISRQFYLLTELAFLVLSRMPLVAWEEHGGGEAKIHSSLRPSHAGLVISHHVKLFSLVANARVLLIDRNFAPILREQASFQAHE